MLTLPIKTNWLDMISIGDKLEEYRAMTQYYAKRLRRYMGTADGNPQNPKIGTIAFRAGYRPDSRKIICTVHCRVGQGKPEWGAEPGEVYYVLDILDCSAWDKAGKPVERREKKT